MASRTRHRLIGLGIGAVPGIVLVFVGILIGEEGGIILGALCVLLAIVGAIVGAVVAGQEEGRMGAVVRMPARSSG